MLPRFSRMFVRPTGMLLLNLDKRFFPIAEMADTLAASPCHEQTPILIPFTNLPLLLQHVLNSFAEIRLVREIIYLS